MPRAIAIFAHPDDEAIALGSRLRRFRSAHFVHVTDGAPRTEDDSRVHGFASWREYRVARERELSLAFHFLGMDDVSRECLGIPDQQAALQLVNLTRIILRLLELHQPEVVFTHPYEGGHPDHDACAFAVHCAVALRKQEPRPELIIEGAFYHAGPHGFESGSFLPAPEIAEETVYELSSLEREGKQALFDCFGTQQEVLHSFSLKTERFRAAPQYLFGKPPHAGPVWYDRQPWGMTSQRFCKLAEEAQSTLAEELESAWR